MENNDSKRYFIRYLKGKYRKYYKENSNLENINDTILEKELNGREKNLNNK